MPSTILEIVIFWRLFPALYFQPRNETPHSRRFSFGRIISVLKDCLLQNDHNAGKGNQACQRRDQNHGGDEIGDDIVFLGDDGHKDRCGHACLEDACGIVDMAQVKGDCQQAGKGRRQQEADGGRHHHIH